MAAVLQTMIKKVQQTVLYWADYYTSDISKTEFKENSNRPKIGRKNKTIDILDACKDDFVKTDGDLEYLVHSNSTLNSIGTSKNSYIIDYDLI